MKRAPTLASKCDRSKSHASESADTDPRSRETPHPSSGCGVFHAQQDKTNAPMTLEALPIALTRHLGAKFTHNRPRRGSRRGEEGKTSGGLQRANAEGTPGAREKDATGGRRGMSRGCEVQKGETQKRRHPKGMPALRFLRASMGYFSRSAATSLAQARPSASDVTTRVESCLASPAA